eukprot:1191897-Prorocentrum_minimum.AAC.1
MANSTQVSKSNRLARARWKTTVRSPGAMSREEDHVLMAVENIFLGTWTPCVGTKLLEGRWQSGEVSSSRGAPVRSMDSSASPERVKDEECDPRTCEGTSTSEHTVECTRWTAPLITPERPRKTLLPSMPSLYEDEEVVVCEAMPIQKTPKLARCCRSWQRDIVQKSLSKCFKNAHEAFIECLKSKSREASAERTLEQQKAVNLWHARRALQAAAKTLQAERPPMPKAPPRRPGKFVCRCFDCYSKNQFFGAIRVVWGCATVATAFLRNKSVERTVERTMERLLSSRLCASRGISVDEFFENKHPSFVPLKDYQPLHQGLST